MEQVQERQQLAQEQRALLKELLGKELGQDAIPGSNPFADVLSFLSPQQQQQVADIRERLKSTMRQGASGGESPEERRQVMREAERLMEDDLSRIMTPQEKEEHDLRLSQTAAKMREQLSAFEPTELEFRSLFRYRKEFEDTVADLAGRTDGESLKQAAEEQFFTWARGTFSNRGGSIDRIQVMSPDSMRRSDDQSAAQQRFLSLFLRSEREIFRYVAALVPNVTDAEDIVQETVIALWEKFDVYDPLQPFTPWACRFALNKTRQWIERRQRDGNQISNMGAEKWLMNPPPRHPEYRPDTKT